MYSAGKGSCFNDAVPRLGSIFVGAAMSCSCLLWARARAARDYSNRVGISVEQVIIYNILRTPINNEVFQPWSTFFLPTSLDCAIFPPRHIPSPDEPQDGMQPPCPPQDIFSIYVPWPVSRHSEPLTSETDKNRLSARTVGRPRPPWRLQSQRKVTITWS